MHFLLPLPLPHFPLPFPLPPHQRRWQWPLPPNNCWRLPFFSTFYNCCSTFSTFNTIALNFMAAHCATPPQASEKKCSSEVKSSATWIAVKRDAVQPDALQLCDASSSASVCSAVHHWSGGELHYNYCPIRTIGGEWGQEIDTSSKLHPTPSSAGEWMLSQNLIHFLKWKNVIVFGSYWSEIFDFGQYHSNPKVGKVVSFQFASQGA